MAWAPDGLRLAVGRRTAGSWKVVILHDAEESVIVGSSLGPIESLAWDADARHLAWAELGGCVVLRNLATMSERRDCPRRQREALVAVAFSPDGQWLAYQRVVSGRINPDRVGGVVAMGVGQRVAASRTEFRNARTTGETAWLPDSTGVLRWKSRGDLSRLCSGRVDGGQDWCKDLPLKPYPWMHFSAHTHPQQLLVSGYPGCSGPMGSGIAIVPIL
jgi:hypothetical protein